jgi:hypothetical protein
LVAGGEATNLTREGISHQLEDQEFSRRYAVVDPEMIAQGQPKGKSIAGGATALQKISRPKRTTVE